MTKPKILASLVAVTVIAGAGTHFLTKQARPEVLGSRENSKTAPMQKKPGANSENKIAKPATKIEAKANAETPDAIIYQLFKEANEESSIAQKSDGDYEAITADQQAINAMGAQ